MAQLILGWTRGTRQAPESAALCASVLAFRHILK